MKLKVNSFFSSLSKSKVLVFSCFFILFLNCKKEDEITKTAYKSDFSKIAQMALPALEYWTNNIEEWQIVQDRIECLVSKENRKIYLQTRQIDNKQGDLEMKVRLGFFNHKISSLNKNWAGFHIGANNNLNDGINHKKGIHIGMCTNGALFIGSPSPNHQNKIIIDALKKGVDLKISILNSMGSYTIDFSILDIETGKILGRISKKDIASEQITGDFCLVSNFENSTNDKGNSIKSVWFQDWEITGSKVAMLHKN